MNPALTIKRFTPTDRRMYFDPWKYDNASIALTAQPTAISIFANQRASICNYCLSQKDTSKCSQCKTYYYCSKDCQMKDWGQHKAECKFLAFLQKPEMPCNMLLILRLFLNKIILEDFYCNFDLIPPQRLQEFQEISALIFKQMEKFNSATSSETFRMLIELQCKVQLNSFGNDTFVALYETSNYFNHKCHRANNCTHLYDGRNQVIMFNDTFAKEKNPSGAPFELTLCYCPIADKEKRRKFLKENYGFDCECQICQSGEEEYVELKSPSEKIMLQCRQMLDLSDQYELMSIITNVKKSVRLFKNDRYMQLFEGLYLKLLSEEKFKDAYRVVKILVLSICLQSKWLDYPHWLNMSVHPILGSKLQEASKLAFHLNFLVKAEQFGKQALQIQQKTGKPNPELAQMVQDIQCQMKLSK